MDSKLNEQLKCQFCDGIFKRRQNLAHHTSMYHEKPPEQTFHSYCCDLCEKIFSNRSLLERHIDYVHNENKVRFQCDKCDKSYESNVRFYPFKS